ncbi:MAG TPA: DNA-3-methyladenine glycosylase, partial [Thermoanaerobaculaceae bacterium]|nr:DNA-3-methyladenine glycosylase [Thermoanaerobaculaceae bacterium]
MGLPLSGAALAALAPLESGFYQRATRAVARALLGKLLLRRLPEGLVAVRITEVEAYLGVADPAAHTYRGRRTPRNEAMWGEGGHLYVYFTYGMHHCCNVVTRRAGVAEAVLLRGAVAVRGERVISARRGGRSGPGLLDGPAKLCQGLAIDKALNGAELTGGVGVWLASDGFRCRSGWVRRLPRVGVAYAGDAANWPLRFVVALD